MTRRWIVVTALAAVAFFAANFAVSWLLARPAHRAISQPGPVVVVAMPTLTWDDVSAETTPHLWSLAQRGAIGNVVTRTISPHSCSQPAWLTLSAGARTTWGKPTKETGSDGVVDPCPVTPEPVAFGPSATFTGWDRWRTESMSRPVKGDIGLIASEFGKRGQCVAAGGPLAAYGAADREGTVSRYWADPNAVDFGQCQVNLIDLGTTSDAALGALLRRIPANTTVVVTGHADDATPERLRAAVVAGPGVRQGLLRSPATRQPGLIQATDLTALLMSRLDENPASMLAEGRRPAVQPEADLESAVGHVRGISLALRDEHRLVAPFFYTYVGLLLVALGVGLALLRAGAKVARRWFGALGAWAGAVPVSTFLVGLVPWWSAPSPGIALVGGILGIAALLAAVALLGPWRAWVAGPAVVLAATTALVIAIDVTHSSRLQLISIMGLQPVYGGRFFGMGNVAYALFASCAILVAALLAGRWLQRDQHLLAALTVIALGAGAIIVDGHPGWGADAGGPLAMLPAFGYLALNAAGLTVTWQRIVGVGGVAMLLVGGLGYLDSLRPPQYRTHIGRFVAGFLESGSTTALQRNVMLNLQMLTSQWINLFVPVLLAVAMYALMRRDSRIGRPVARLTSRVRFLGHGLAAITICWLIGFCTNDSGTAIPPSGMIVIIPLVLLIAASRGQTAPADVRRREELASRHVAPAPAG